MHDSVFKLKAVLMDSYRDSNPQGQKTFAIRKNFF